MLRAQVGRREQHGASKITSYAIASSDGSYEIRIEEPLPTS